MTIPSGKSSTTFYYADGNQGTPQITADPGTMVPAIQNEIITSEGPSPERVTGNAQHVGSNKMNGSVAIKGRLAVPNGIQLHPGNLDLRQAAV